MKALLITGLLFLSQAAMAFPVLDCNNPATGAEFRLSVYGNQPASYAMNSALIESLEQQGARSVSPQGSGGQVQFGQNLSFSANGSNGYLSINPEGGGYRLRLVQYQGAHTTFFFNGGECRNSGI